MTSSYRDFIQGKHFKQESAGFDAKDIHADLFDYQRACVEWACRRGRSALFLDTGLGKTNCELEWSRQVVMHTGGRVLLLAPLAVGHQHVREAAAFGYSARFTQNPNEVDAPGVYVTNYESLHKFDASAFVGVCLDESSILKSIDGRMRKMITESFSRTPYRLSATATPSPNDFMEIGTQSEFLGILTQTEMLATFFIHDGGDTSKWRLKGHGKAKFFEWLASWAVVMRDPSAFGFSAKPKLPELRVHQITVETERKTELFAEVAQGLGERLEARRDTVAQRCEKAAEIVAQFDEPVLLWCARNDEGDLLESLTNGVQVAGSDTDAAKEDRLIGFADGKYQKLVTKPKIAGFGMNWQHCSKMVFVGLSDSWEQYYQAIRRCWRYGQQRPVDVYVVCADIEGAVVMNIKRKQEQADIMAEEMASIASKCFKGFGQAARELAEYKTKKVAPQPSFKKRENAA